jgi:hypothetical protein
MTIIRGHQAIAAAAALGVTLCKYADPIENARAGVTVEEATEIARDDAGLLFLEVNDDLDECSVFGQTVETDDDAWRRVAADDAETFGREAW